jgi:hypothetical protein
MDSHRELGGFWDVFDVRMGLDVVISIHRADGVRQLSLAGHQRSRRKLKPGFWTG